MIFTFIHSSLNLSFVSIFEFSGTMLDAKDTKIHEMLSLVRLHSPGRVTQSEGVQCEEAMKREGSGEDSGNTAGWQQACQGGVSWAEKTFCSK